MPDTDPGAAVEAGVRHRLGRFTLPIGGRAAEARHLRMQRCLASARVPLIDGRAAPGRCLTPTPVLPLGPVSGIGWGCLRYRSATLRPKPDTFACNGVWLRPEPSDRRPRGPGPMPDTDPGAAVGAGVRHRLGMSPLSIGDPAAEARHLRMQRCLPRTQRPAPPARARLSRVRCFISDNCHRRWNTSDCSRSTSRISFRKLARRASGTCAHRSPAPAHAGNRDDGTAGPACRSRGTRR